MAFWSGFLALGQEHPFDEKAWAEATKDMTFVEKRAEPSNFGFPNWNVDFNGQIFQYLVFGTIFGFLIYFLVRYLRSLQSNAASEASLKIEVNSLQEAEENPMQADLGKLIAKLVAEQKFREATRAYFLLILQRLYSQNRINYQKQKTNFDYVGEVKNEDFYAAFASLTTFFERIWYGSSTLAQHDFYRIEPAFKALLKTITDEKKK